jgi:type II secretory pathway predicted ATPase ExeA
MPSLPLDPLALTADPRRYVPLESSERALAELAMQLRECRSPVLLTGSSGIGKTLLLHVLAERERSWARRVRLSLSLDRAADELAGWLLQYLFGSSTPEAERVEVALVEGIRGLGRERLLLVVDQIHRAPRDSVRKLEELARAGKPELAVLVAGVPARAVRARRSRAEATVSPPDFFRRRDRGAFEAIRVDPDSRRG